MNPPASFIPFLPETAPFTPEQRAYLNGFLAGLFSFAPAPAAGAAPARQETLASLTVLFGSQTGNAENLAKRIAREAGHHGFAATIHDLAKYPPAQLASEQHLLVVTSTYGDGEPPDNARSFWESLAGEAAPQLAATRFSVCALGDTNYPKFCQFGKDVDARLESLGGQRVHPRQDCDVEFEEPFVKWLSAALGALAHSAANVSSNGSFPLTPALSPGERGNQPQSPRGPLTDHSSMTEEKAENDRPLFPLPGGEGQGEGEAPSRHSRTHPFPARLVTNRKLNGPGSGKEVRHFEIALEGSGLAYEVGDALGVFPTNCPALVNEVLGALGCDGEEAVPGKGGRTTSLRQALLAHYDLGRIPQPFAATLAERSGDETLRKLTAPGANGELTMFLWGREIIDLLLAHPRIRFVPGEFVALLKKLPPRLYSISSSPRAHPGQVHLTVGIVRYESFGRPRKGVCSTFLADRVTDGTPVPVFVHANQAFRPPAPDVPLIMVGPGTGIAPFRAYLEERQATGAKGKNWLFFGDQRAATDFLYRDEIESFQRDGLLTRLDLAWSRDQAGKVYVQHRMLEQAGELFAWLEAGAAFHVCGDASRMAKDVDAALHEVIQKAGGRTPGQAAEYVKQLKAQQRYQRDVY